MDLPPASQRVLAAARDLGLSIQIRTFPDGTKTSADAAAAVGCALSAIAKSLVFMADDHPVVVIMPGDRRVDPKKLAVVMGAKSARRASLDEARSATGFAAGGTPAFGYPDPLPVWRTIVCVDMATSGRQRAHRRRCFPLRSPSSCAPREPVS